VQEKRRAERRKILENFSFFVVVPTLGGIKKKLQDLSETGIGFQFDTLGTFSLTQNAEVDIHFYLNQTLFLPLKVRIARLGAHAPEVQEVGCEIISTTSPSYATFLTLVKLIDQLESTAEEI
jgi:hypothetical protein